MYQRFSGYNDFHSNGRSALNYSGKQEFSFGSMRHTFRDDVFGGITSAIVMLPMASAFGAALGLGPAAGVYGAVAVGFFAAAFGGTPAQISGPTGPMMIAMAAVVTLYAHDLTTAFTIVMLAGLIQISMGSLRVGCFVSYVPYSVSSVSMSSSTFPPGISWTVLTRRNDY